MNAIHLRKHIDSDLVHAIPELREMLGQDVEITVRSVEEMVELRAAAATDPILASALDFAESVVVRGKRS